MASQACEGPLDGGTSDCYRIKSWCGRFLSVILDDHSLQCLQQRRLKFLQVDDAGFSFVLLPLSDGRYHIKVCQSCSLGQGRGCPKGADEYICCIGTNVSLTSTDSDATPFAFDYDEHGRVSLRGGPGSGYLTSNEKGQLWSGTRLRRKWEYFELIREGGRQPGNKGKVEVPVRVNLRAHTNKYLCTVGPTLAARAEAPCCCDELILDLPIGRGGSVGPGRPPSIASRPEADLGVNSECSELDDACCTLRTADGESMLIMDPDGSVRTAPLNRAQGREIFALVLTRERRGFSVAVRSCTWEGRERGVQGGPYLSAERSGLVVCNRQRSQRWERFALELTCGARVLIQSTHGTFLASDPSAPALPRRRSSNSPPNARPRPTPGAAAGRPRDLAEPERPQRRLCACAMSTRAEVESAGAWQLRSHGDGLYTLVAVPTLPGLGDIYLFVDAHGRVMQSNEPNLHFPATASLFAIKPVARFQVEGRQRARKDKPGDLAIAGFAIRTVRRVNGKQLYLCAEPNGRLTASRLRAGSWETFALIDVDAVAAAVEPREFVCMPASVFSRKDLPPSRPPPAPAPSMDVGVPSHTALLLATLTSRIRQRRGGIHAAQGGAAVDAAMSAGAESERRKHSAASAVRKAAGVAAEGVLCGVAVPRRSPATLQELCVSFICTHASRWSETSRDRSSQGHSSHHGGGVTYTELDCLTQQFPDELSRELYNVPDDLLIVICAEWAARQSARDLLGGCKRPPGSDSREGLAAILGQGAVPPPILGHHHRLPPPPQPAARLANLRPQPAQRGVPGVARRAPGNSNSTEPGWHCIACHAGDVLPMDPSVNPAHHRYLEMQSHVQSGAAHTTGLLWNAISISGMSIMTATLLVHALEISTRP